ncbi:hypothetical protein ABIB49_003851 [Arthrobacter sp. UYCu512]|uniref:hypothetical protein n=1 Tax=Arthrobacter sp. UYCu512 TaxID=3156338 RepID=UPI003398BAA5
MNEGHDVSDLTFLTLMPGSYRVGVLILGVLTTSAVVIPLSAEIPSVMSLVLAILLVALFAAAFLMQAVVRLGTNGVHIRVAGVFRTTIHYDQITGAAPDRVTRVREGMGLRILPNKTTGYLVGGPSVRINTSGGTAVLVSSKTPAELSEAIGRRT